MPGPRTFVIAGASLAGAKAAQALREEGFDGSIVLIGAEDERPYERPPLSKDLLLGKAEPDSVYVHEAGWYDEHDVELRLGTTALSLDRTAREVRLADGSAVGYDRLLLATGASPRRLQVPGGDLDNVLYLRTLTDSVALKAALVPGAKVVIAGGGWIGLETAAAARQAGCEVTIVEPESAPLQRAVGPEIGGYFAGLHREHGVAFRLGEGVSELRGDAGGPVRQVVTTAGAELPADVVIVAIGAAPNVGLAADAGLPADSGVLTDASLRTADGSIWAAGDVACYHSPVLGRRIRVEHWSNALNGGSAAARAMLGLDVTYDRVPYFFSDQYDLGMECAGLPEPGRYDQVLYRGDRDSGEFVVFWLSQGSVIAGMNVNVWDVNDDIQGLIRVSGPVRQDRLTDTDTPLSEVGKG